jgi:hypothetical protein
MPIGFWIISFVIIQRIVPVFRSTIWTPEPVVRHVSDNQLLPIRTMCAMGRAAETLYLPCHFFLADIFPIPPTVRLVDQNAQGNDNGPKRPTPCAGPS